MIIFANVLLDKAIVTNETFTAQLIRIWLGRTALIAACTRMWPRADPLDYDVVISRHQDS